MIELKPCPFCGGEAEILRQNIGSDFYEYRYWACCSDQYCPAGEGTILKESPEEAAEIWNRRAGE